MRRTTILGSGFIFVLGLLGTVACSSDGDGNSGDGTPGMGGGASRGDTEDVASLRAQIEALRELLEEGDGDAETIAALRRQLEEAEERLANLEGCGPDSPISCDALDSTTGSLSALTDAYCDWLFGCCSEEEARVGAGPSYASVDECKATYESLLERGSASIYFPVDTQRVGGGELLEVVADVLSTSAAQAWLIEQGRLSFDADALSACAAEIDSLSCDQEPSRCRTSFLDTTCTSLWTGQVSAGQSCRTSVECEDGLICGSEVYGYGFAFFEGDGGADGLCIVEATVGDDCVIESDCATSDRTLYCDRETGTCAARPGQGESCRYADPTFDDGKTVLVPCQAGLDCSTLTFTCEAPCSAGAYCYASYSNIYDQRNNRGCAEGLVCNRTDVSDNLYFREGSCSEPFKKGDLVEAAHECESGTIYGSTEGNRCRGIGGESCDVSSECASGSCTGGVCVTYCGGEFEDACDTDEYCDSISCEEKRNASASCSQDEECLSGLCVDSVCRDAVTSGGDCSTGPSSGSSRLCPDDEFCDNPSSGTYTCTSRFAEAASCDGADQCAAGLLCVDGSCDKERFRDDGAPCSTWYHCVSERCDPVTDTCQSGGLSEGSACDADSVTSGAENTNIAFDECEKGLYCERTAPQSDTDFSGVCRAQKAPGSLCNTTLDANVRQCDDNARCETHDDWDLEVCPVVVEEVSMQCTLEDVPTRLFDYLIDG